MIRRGTLLWLSLALIMAGVVFVISVTVKERERELKRLETALQHETETMHVLRAEWAYLTQPGRIGELAARHLTLEPTPAARVVAISDIPYPADAQPAPGQKPAPGVEPARPSAPPLLAQGRSRLHIIPASLRTQ